MNGRWVGGLLLVMWIPLVLSCSPRLTRPDRFPEAVILYDVGPYRQEPEQCGPYALAALLHFQGIESHPQEISRRLYSPGAGGTLTMDLFLEAGRRGLKVRQERGSAESLTAALADGAPVIVLLRYPGLRGSTGHFVPVTGYSSQPPGFFFLWGDGKRSWMAGEAFRKLWEGSGFWMLRVEEEGRP